MQQINNKISILEAQMSGTWQQGDKNLSKEISTFLVLHESQFNNELAQKIM